MGRCRVCGAAAGGGSLCLRCEFLLEKGVRQETLKRWQNTMQVEKVLRENGRFSVKLADAYYDSLLKKSKNVLKNDSKENFGYNTFIAGIELGLDMVLPLVDTVTRKEIREQMQWMMVMRTLNQYDKDFSAKRKKR
jgi:hypothetical protein